LFMTMAKVKFFLVAINLLYGGIVFSQSVISSSTYIRTCIDKTECSSINNASYLFYDQGKQAFYLKLDFNLLRIGMDSVDYWLDDLDETNLYFKAEFDQENFRELTNNQHRTFKLNAQVFLNGIWRHQVIEMTMYSTESMILTGRMTDQNLYDNFKINLSFTIMPQEFKIHKKPHHLKKSIFVGIALGRINQLMPGQQGILGEAYDYH
jgi:hypothetical protein